MTNNKQDSLTKLETTVSSASLPKKNTPLNNNSLLVFVLLALLILIILIFSIDFIINKKQENKHQQLANHLFQSKLTKIEEYTNALQREINEVKTEEALKNKDNQTQLEALKSELKEALNQRFYQNNNWILLKARYYLELAEINAHWSNSSSTLALLKQADTILSPMKGNSIFAIRQAIAKDIGTIESIPTVDIPGILSEIDSLQNTVAQLNFLTTPKENNSLKLEKKESSWKNHFEESLSNLGKLIIIRHHEEHITPSLSPELELILKNKIQLNLQTAQWAVLNHNYKTYQLALSNTLDIIRTHFKNANQVEAIIGKKINQLQQIELVEKTIHADSALPLLNQLIDDTSKNGESQISNNANQQGVTK